VLTLLRSGDATGALARWRALHEIATRAESIRQNRARLQETARRYLQHEDYRLRLELGVYQGFAPKVDPESALDSEDTKLLATLNQEFVARTDLPRRVRWERRRLSRGHPLQTEWSRSVLLASQGAGSTLERR
jgi:hypothetical protein